MNFDDMQDESATAPPSAHPKMSFDDMPDESGKSSLGDTAADVGKSGAIGVVKGGIGLAGLPGDAASLLNRGVDWGLNKLGLQQSTPTNYNLGTSGQLQNAVEGVTGPLYEPKTSAGHVAQAAGEFLPTMIGGPESLATKALTRVAAPAVAGETARQAAAGTEYEPYAETAGTVAGALLGHHFERLGSAVQSIPSAQQLKDAATAGYQHPEVEAVRIRQGSLTKTANDITSDLLSKGFRNLNTPQTFGMLEELKTPLQVPGVAANAAFKKVADVDSVRRALNKVAGNYSNPSEQEAARLAIGKIDDYLANLKQPDLVSGNAKRATEILQEARGNWSAARHSELMEGKLSDAELQAAATYSGGNLDNATRQKIKSILTNNNLRRGYSQGELDQMESIVRGSKFGNLSRKVGKILGGGGGLGQAIVGGGGLYASYETGDPRYLALPLLGVAGRKLGELNTTRAAQKLEENIRARAPEAKSWAAIANRIGPQRGLSNSDTSFLRSLYLSPALRARLGIDQSKP